MVLKPNTLQVLDAYAGAITVDVFHDIEELMAELHEDPLSVSLRPGQVTRTLNSNTVVVMTDENARIIGMATLIDCHTFTRSVGRVEHVVVSELHRGKGIGKKIMERVHELARERGLKRLDLTSNPRREAAHHLYRSLGYKTRDTTCFRLGL